MSLLKIGLDYISSALFARKKKKVKSLRDKPVSSLALFGIRIWQSFWLKTNFFFFNTYVLIVS